ncbi:MAG: ABC transporter permease, partial [Acidobacteria bacterium]|nr:ABC transporter permease [Acidobacteriota bacterium]
MESAPGTVQPVAVISRQFWKQKFDDDPSAIGSTLTLNGTPLTVIGVLAPPFDVTSVPADGYFIGGDVFLPVAQFPAPQGIEKAGPFMLAVGRLRPDVSVASSHADLAVISERLAIADRARSRPP